MLLLALDDSDQQNATGSSLLKVKEGRSTAADLGVAGPPSALLVAIGVTTVSALGV